MQNKNISSMFRSRSRAIALEPRLLFDGAGGVAVADAFDDTYTEPEQNQNEAGHDDTDTNGILNGDELHVPGGSSPSTLVIIDSRVEGFQNLLADLPANTVVRVVDSEESGLAAISDELAKGRNFEAVHIFSHGTPGSFTLGSDQVDSSTLASQAEQLSSWSNSLTEEADILLYGCDVAQGEAGQAFISELAHLTGADIAASTNATGAADKGGDWVLESNTGSIEAEVFEFGAYGELLGTEPKPTVSMDVPEGNEVLIGGKFDFTLSFENQGADGFGPYVDLYLPKGADGDDGIDVAASGAITYLGESVNYQIITLNSSGKAVHPYATGADGAALQLSGDAGQKVVVIELPFGSFTSGQPTAELQVSATVSNKADLGTALTIKAQSGFRYGNNALGNGGSVIDDVSNVETTITPTLVDYSYTFSGPEGETATGPNFPREMTTHIKVAPGQTLTGYELKIGVPNNAIVTHIDGVALGTPVTGSDVTKALGDITGDKDVVLKYYIPDVLDANSGGASTSEFQVSGTGHWIPVDTRDAQGDQSYDPEGVEYSHAIKSLAVQKTVTGTHKPGGTLNYTLDFQVSDYFQFKDVVITDVIDDGHTLADPVLTITYQGEEYTVSLVGYFSSAISAEHDITRTYNVSAALIAARDLLPEGLQAGILTGGKFGANNSSGTFGRIEYTATINDKFVSAPASPTNDIKHGDTLKTNATISGNVVKVGGEAGSEVTDATNTEVAIVTGGMKLDVVKVNGTDVPANGIKPGDTVTYELTYDLSNGDFADLKLDAFLPKPVFDVSGVWTQDTQGSVDPAAGHWKLMDTSVLPTGGEVQLDIDANSNGMKFSLGNRTDTDNKPGQIVIRFTVTVADDPFVDGLFLTAQAQGQDNNTPGDANSHQAIKKIQLNEPVLEIKHGIVSTTGSGVISGTTGTWQNPGESDQPFTGTVTSIDGINGNITKIDAGDKVTFAAGIINKGGSAAYDIATSTFTVADGFKLIQQDGSDAANLSEANLKVYKGDGALLIKNTHYTVSGAGVITLTNTGPDLAVGRNGTTTVNNGSNILIITYDAVALTTIAAGKATTSSFSVETYAGKENGKDFLLGEAKITDTATAAVSEPSVKIVFKDGSIDNTDSSSASTTGADMVIGETMIYDIVVTLPEGTTHDLNVKALVPDGMRLDTSYNGGTGYEVITTKGTDANQSDALQGNFAGGALGVPTVTGMTGALSADPVFEFGNVTVTDDNTTTNNSFVIRVKLIVANTNSSGSGAANNQDGQTRIPSTSLTYDKGGNTTGADNDKNIAAVGNNSTITIREPKLTIEKTVDTNVDDAGVQSGKVDAGDTIEYTITIKHAANSYDAYDLTFDDTFDSVLGMNTSANWSVMQGTTDISGQFEWVTVDGKDKLQTKANANVDLAKTDTIIIKAQGTTKASVAAKATFDSDATVRWSSIDSTDASVRDANERDGSGGVGIDATVLNNYAAKDGAPVEVNASYTLSRVGGLEDTLAPEDTKDGAQNVAVGEIVRFRVVMQMPEGEIPELSMIPQLGSGYELLSGGATWALVGRTGGIFNVSGEHVVVSSDVPGNIENTLNSTNTQDAANRPGGAATLADGKFTLGTIKNTDTDNSKAEYIVLEFNAIVKNDAANTAGTALNSKVEIHTGTTKLGESNTTIDTVVEPQISAVVKNVVDIAPGAQSGDPHQITVSNTFTTGSTNAAPAYDVKLVEQFPSGSEYTITSVKIGGTSYTVDALPVGVTAVVTGTDSGIELNFEKLEPGTAVEVLYTVKVPTTAEQAGNTDTNATLTWSSLPGDETSANLKFAGAAGGIDGTVTGERIGTETVDANNYLRTDPAGYGTISGTLWDDTKNRDGSIDTGEARLSGVTVTLKWTNPAGAERTLTTTTDANGKYSFGALPLGDYTITAPGDLTVTVDGDEDRLKPRFDADGSANGLGTIEVTLSEGAAQAEQNIGYLQENDAPTVIFTNTAEREFTEGVNTSGDTSVLGTAVNMGAVTIADLELERGLDNYNDTTLIVGRNNAANNGFAGNPDDVLAFDGTKVTVSGANIQVNNITVATFTNVGGLLTITFNSAADAAKVNTVASAITYANSSQHPGVAHGTSYNINLRYSFNDANDDDKQGYGGALTGDATVGVKIIVQNDPPVANDDPNGLLNTHEQPITGNVITGVHKNGSGVESTNGTDTDPDNPGDLRITGILKGETGTPEAVGAGATIIAGQYGTLTINSDGSYSYVLDQNNSDVYGLAKNATLNEEFTYTLSDGDKTDTAKLVITVTGDTPLELGVEFEDHNGTTDGHATVYESGLSTGSEKGSNKHIHKNGKITVTSPTGLQTLEVGNVTFTPEQIKNASQANPLIVTTPLGTLTITGATIKGDPDAPKSVVLTYTYKLDKAANNTQETDEQGLTDEIELVVKDVGDNTASSKLKVYIVDDVPTAKNDVNEILVATGTVTGNVYSNDIIGADGPATSGPVTPVVGHELTYGKLTLNADGSYTYVVNPNHADVIALSGNATLTDTYTYTITDADGDVSTATLTVTIKDNTPPEANNDFAETDEDTPVSGNLLTNDKDPDGDPITVTEITVGGTTTKVPTDGSNITITVPGKGSITVNKNGGYTFTPNPGVIGKIPDIGYKITDGNGGDDTAKLSINVKPGNPPVAPPVTNVPNDGNYSPLGGTPEITRMKGLTDSAVITDPSVFYEGERHDDVRRLPIPLQPIVYVNNEVAMSQQERQTDDMRADSSPAHIQPFAGQSISLAMGLGQDRNLFVSHAVRDTQRTAAGLDSRVTGRLSRVDLSADDMLASNDLRSMQFAQVDADEAEKAKQKRQQAAQVEENEGREDEVALQEFDADDADIFAEQQSVMPVAASFTEQLRGTSKHLPFAAREKNFLI
ncbi:MAG: DUF4347 domain-containing protein [Thiopseudomonas sp.]|nr:DUF4347 domain-containing protein [Thiopseudomonas sp.]MCK9465499.1 DUF4347 domain-containing protein [Thiopseudomonas sp.]